MNLPVVAVGASVEGSDRYYEPVTSEGDARDLIKQLDGWVNNLARPLLPPRMVAEGDRHRLEFRHHDPQVVMIGKLVRAVSGIKAALALADLGYIVECGALLRIVSDLCEEISAIGDALRSGGELPNAVHKFIEQYFSPRARTPEEFASQERTRYVTREELMKVRRDLVQSADERDKLLVNRRFLNKIYDDYVHGAYETTMELYNLQTGQFMTSGYLDASNRDDFLRQ